MDLKSTVLGLEMGSTRIKAVLLDERHTPLASGSYEWESRYVNGVWTYDMCAVHEGLRACYATLATDVERRLGKRLTTVGAIGISGMMHGYLPLDKNGQPLTEFRTWRNTMTGQAAEELTRRFGFNIPQRWSIAHLYQAVLNGEKQTADIACLTTLAGYVHFCLTGEKVLGVGEASGMFPIDSTKKDYDDAMVRTFDALVEPYGFSWRLRDILPEVLSAGAVGGRLTTEGARLLDPSGTLTAGIPLAPPEGDAGTGMVATNSVRKYTGNVSAGTSDFAMIVVDHVMGVHRELDMVTTPDGAPVAMVHCNNCTSEINAWVELFGEFAAATGHEIDKETLFTTLFRKALEGEADCGGLLSCNYLSGEGITDFNRGYPLFLRTPDSRFSLANIMRMHLLSALATLRIGMDIMTKEERVRIDRLYGHGGYFKTPEVGQRMLSAAMGTPVSVMETAGDGGPYGMAILAGYMLWKTQGETLANYLDRRVFAGACTLTLLAEKRDIEGFNAFLANYKKLLVVERAAVAQNIG